MRKSLSKTHGKILFFFIFSFPPFFPSFFGAPDFLWGPTFGLPPVPPPPSLRVTGGWAPRAPSPSPVGPPPPFGVARPSPAFPGPLDHARRRPRPPGPPPLAPKRWGKLSNPPSPLPPPVGPRFSPGSRPPNPPLPFFKSFCPSLFFPPFKNPPVPPGPPGSTTPRFFPLPRARRFFRPQRLAPRVFASPPVRLAWQRSPAHLPVKLNPREPSPPRAG